VPATGARPFLVQEYLPGVTEGGEVSLVFFEGTFSHALLKCPQAGEFRVNSQYGGTVSLLGGPPAVLVDQARATLDALPEVPLYARVDGVWGDGRFVLLELELNEPALGLHLAPAAADRFADAIVERLAALRVAR
jgi:glutathione synthase/RimK-type ligase-like ATP-grasp enzyme